ncbi:MAG: ESPR-type extended signal peptide-containing protein [Bordetella sp.]|nr:ESPR-type extended signal peptide-containing protein [Pseudomonadota bacterium]
MNKSYRTIWNDTLGAWVAASETAKARGKPSRTSATASQVAMTGGLLLALAGAAAPAWADFSQNGAAGASCSRQGSGPGTGSWTCQVPNGSGGFATVSGVPDDGSGTQPNYVTLANWVASNLGANAIALGSQGTKASGANAIAIGNNANGAVPNAVALGSDTNVTVDGGVALGSGSLASADAKAGASPYIPPGAAAAQINDINATKATTGAVSVGGNGTLRQITNLAAGSADSDAVNVSQLKAASAAAAAGAVHYYSVKDSGSTQGNYANNGATGLSSIAVGPNAIAAGQSSTGLGTYAAAYGDSSIAVGQATASAAGAVSIGLNSAASIQNSVSLGHDAGLNATAASGDRPAVYIGNGAGMSATGGGNIGLGLNALQNAVGTDNVGIGFRAGWNSIGANNVAVGIGAGQGVNADSTVSIGAGAVGSKINAIAVGTGAQANGSSSISIGTGNVVSGNRSGAIGDPTLINADDSYAIGNNNTINASAKQSFVLGNGVTVNNANNVVLGNASADKAAAKVTSASIPSVIATLNPDGTTSYSAGPLLTYGGFAGTASGVVSVGAVGAERQIVNVAPGAITATSTDAINGSQLYSVASQVNAIGGQIVNIVNNANTHFYSVNGGTSADGNYLNNGATAQGAIASGINASASATNSVAMGTNASATTANSAALGANSTTGATTSTTGTTIRGTTYTFAGGTSTGVVSVGSVGGERQVTNVAAGQLNANSTDAVNGSQLYATNTAINNLSIQVGAGINVTTAQTGTGIAIGTSVANVGPGGTATYTAGDNMVLTQNGTNTTFAVRSNPSFTTVTVGNTTINDNGVRITNGPSMTINGINAGGQTITNVAPGVNGTDAVNVNQLNGMAAANNARLNALGDKINSVGTKAYAGVASAMAVQAPALSVPGKTTMRIGYGYYQGESAMGVSFRRTSENNAWSLTGGASASRGGVAATVGAEWVFN